MNRPFLNLSAAVFLAVVSSSCVLAIGTGSDEQGGFWSSSKDAKGVKLTTGTDAALAKEGGGEKDANAATPEAKAKKDARKAEKKALNLTYARMEMALAEMDAENELRDSNFELEHARHEVEAAQRELDHFTKMERPLDLEDSQMNIDRSSEGALEQKQELDELMAMYKKDDFAKMTKELVITRGKFRMEIAQRELELTKKRAADKKEHDWAVKEHDLTLALAKTKEGVTSAEAKLKKTQAHNELELMRARHKIEDAERGDDDEDSGGGDAKDKGK